MDEGMIMEVPELLIKVIVTGIVAKTIAITTYNSCKAVNIFVEEEAGQLFEEVLHIDVCKTIHSHTVHKSQKQWKRASESDKSIYRR